MPSLKLKLVGQPVDNFCFIAASIRRNLQLEALADDLAGQLLDSGSANQSDQEVGRVIWRQFGVLRLLQLGSEYSRGLGGVGLQLLSRQHLTHLEGGLAIGVGLEVFITGVERGALLCSMKPQILLLKTSFSAS